MLCHYCLVFRIQLPLFLTLGLGWPSKVFQVALQKERTWWVTHWLLRLYSKVITVSSINFFQLKKNYTIKKKNLGQIIWDLSHLTKDWTHFLCSGSAESYSLELQGHLYKSFKGYFSFTVITKYCQYSPCCLAHPWTHLPLNSLYLPLPYPLYCPSPLPHWYSLICSLYLWVYLLFDIHSLFLRVYL